MNKQEKHNLKMAKLVTRNIAKAVGAPNSKQRLAWISFCKKEGQRIARQNH